MNSKVRWFTIILVFALVVPAAKATEPQAAPQAPPVEAVAGLLERSSMLLIEIDLSKLDLKASIDWVVKQAGLNEPAGPPDVFIQMASSLIDSLRGAGAERIYVSVATRAFSDAGPIVIIPCRDVAAVEGLAAAALSSLGVKKLLQVRIRAGVVVVGPPKALDRLDDAPADALADGREDLTAPLAGPERLDHAAVLSLIDEYREELAAIWPDSLPRSVPIQMSPHQLAKNIRRVTLTWSLPPRPAIQAIFETADDLSATRVEESVNRILAALSAQIADDPAANNVQPLADIQRDGSDVTLAFTAATIEAVIEQLKRLSSIREATQRSNDLKQIGLAMHNYFGVNNHLPPKYFTNPAGEPLYSWRVAILPFIEQQALYQAFQLDQRWDSPASAALTSLAIPPYADRLGDDPTMTRIRLPVFPGSAWDGEGQPKTFAELTDGTSNTIAAIDAPADAAVPWADPAEWILSADDLVADVFGDRDEVLVLFFDGSVRALQRNEMSNEKLAALLTIAGGEVVER